MCPQHISTKESDVVTYVDPNNIIKCGQSHLFRLCNDSKQTLAYNNWLNMQIRFLTQAHYCKGAAKHNTEVEHWWNVRHSNSCGGNGEHPISLSETMAGMTHLEIMAAQATQIAVTGTMEITPCRAIPM